MHTYLVIFSGGMTILLSLLFMRKGFNHRFKRLALRYNLLFFIIFLVAFFTHESSTPIKEIMKKGFYIGASKVHLQEKAIDLADDLNIDIPAVTRKDRVMLDAPIDRQLPELPRGCEVTSLAMLLQNAGIKVDKLTLAKEIIKDNTPYKRVNGTVFFGNPNKGFVGNIYNKQFPGLGVYHKPIKDLAEKYLPLGIIDFTGNDFKEVEMYLSNGSPVWVITNSTFKKLDPSQFETWHTSEGTINITYYEHSVLLTGYDSENVYFNDPLSGQKNRKIAKVDFIASWEQMGKQAITYVQ